MQPLRGDQRGVTVQIGAILLFGILILALAGYQTTAVPADNERVEFNHNQEVQQDVLDLRNAILRSGTAGGSQAVSVTLGTTYPSRVLFVNPPPPGGSLATTSPQSLVVRNVSATENETQDYLNASANGAYRLQTRGLTYRPGYNVYDSAPVTSVQTGTVVNEFPAGGDTAITGQTVVRDTDLYLLVVAGNLSAARSGALTVDPQPLSRSRDVTVVTDDGTGNVTLVVPTALSADRWQRLLGDEYDPGFDGDGHVYRVSEVTGRDAVELALDGSQTYRLRTALVGVGSGVDAPGPAYLTRADAGDGDVTVVVRDRYNNPVPTSQDGDSLSINVTNGRDVVTPNRVAVDEGGRATFDYVGTIGDVNLTLEAGGRPALDAANGSVAFTVTSDDLPDDRGPEEINPTDGVVLDGAEIVAPSGGGQSTTPDVDVSLRNLETQTDRNISEVRFNFYSVDRQSNDIRTPPLAVDISNQTLKPGNIGGRYRPIVPIEIPAGGTETFRATFYEDEAGTTEFNVQPGDFFILSVVFDNGETATYFIAPTGESTSGGGGGGGSGGGGPGGGPGGG